MARANGDMHCAIPLGSDWRHGRPASSRLAIQSISPTYFAPSPTYFALTLTRFSHAKHAPDQGYTRLGPGRIDSRFRSGGRHHSGGHHMGHANTRRLQSSAGPILRGGRRCHYQCVCRILIKMADPFFSSSWRILEPCGYTKHSREKRASLGIDSGIRRKWRWRRVPRWRGHPARGSTALDRMPTRNVRGGGRRPCAGAVRARRR
jgi:hypothetical protein